ncbi:glycosyltransferase [Streptomyces sp. 110]|uniref:Hyaluronan synthase n=2 Tax=Streptomyces endocoffeicus TaxID=2898945 RepID=A0ABS1PU23_9ACTN|nr:glycosyltransferase [Streptomyces endocoffeicus]
MYLCIDSDTVLDQHAVAEAAAPFARCRVHAVTGLVLAANRRRNLLTRLIDMRYQNAFLGERVAYSRLGSVLCACGSLALYRGATVRQHLDDFLQQRFLGPPCTFGDDRRLTYYCLLEGQSLIVPTAVAWTDVPETMRHFLKQQTRWTKSFIREGVLLALKLRVIRVYWWLNLVELATWAAFTSALLVALTVMAANPHAWTVLAWYAAYVVGAAWLRSVHYFRHAGTVSRWDRATTFLAAPVYALMNLTLLIPLRLWALVTLRDTRWGTRQNGAEIQHDGPLAVTIPQPRLDDDTLEIRWP